MIVNVKNISRETRIIFDVRSRAVVVAAGKTASPDISEETAERMRRLKKIWEIDTDAARRNSDDGPSANLTLSQVSEEKAATVFMPVKERGAAMTPAMPKAERDPGIEGLASVAAQAPGAALRAGAQFVPGAATADDGGIIPRPNFGAPTPAPGGKGKGRDRG